MSIKVNTILSLSSFPEWEDYPARGTSFFRDTRIFEIELEDKDYFYTLLCEVFVEYQRWFTPETYEEPEEDEVDVLHFKVIGESGVMVHKKTSQDLELGSDQLSKLVEEIHKKLIIA